MKAPAVLIDMEEGVVNEILQGPLRDMFDSKQLKIFLAHGITRLWVTKFLAVFMKNGF